jgi:hypothetical protein
MISVRRGIPIKYLLLSISFLVSLKPVTREAYLVTEKKGSRVHAIKSYSLFTIHYSRSYPLHASRITLLTDLRPVRRFIPEGPIEAKDPDGLYELFEIDGLSDITVGAESIPFDHILLLCG